jgi:hypothetical protein
VPQLLPPNRDEITAMQLATRTGLIHEKRWFKHENGGLTMKNGGLTTKNCGLSWFIHENGGLTIKKGWF